MSRAAKERRGLGLIVEEMNTHNETADDADAASLGRARMADGRRIELTVDELARMAIAGTEGE